MNNTLILRTNPAATAPPPAEQPCPPLPPRLAVVIPALDAAGRIGAAIASVQEAGPTEVLVVDGGSSDGTAAAAAEAGARVITAPRGRGGQLRAGAAAAEGDWLLFLHADTVLEPGWSREALAVMEGPADRAAAFRFALDDPAPAARRLEAFVAARCALFKLPYGDQGLLISRALYDRLGGFADVPLFEDVDLVRRIGRARLSLLSARAITSAARFQREGYLIRSARNLSLLARYYLGVSPHELAKRYD